MHGVWGGRGLFFPPPIRRRCGGAGRAGPGAAVVGQSWARPGRAAGSAARRDAATFFFQQRREGGGLNFVMSQISFLWLLLPALLPRLPSARRLASLPPRFFFFYFPHCTSRLQYLRPSASSLGYAGGGERFSWLSTFPCVPRGGPGASVPRRALPPSHGHAGVSGPELMLWSCPLRRQHPAQEPLN